MHEICRTLEKELFSRLRAAKAEVNAYVRDLRKTGILELVGISSHEA